MDNVTIYCQNNDIIKCSKNRFVTFTQGIEEDALIIPQPKDTVIAFLTFLDTCSIPTLKPDDVYTKQTILSIINIAQFCNLKDRDIPGKLFLIDLVYENMENEFSVKFDFLIDFENETKINIYDYNFCKFVICYWKDILIYGMFMNNQSIKQKQIDKLLILWAEFNK